MLTTPPCQGNVRLTALEFSGADPGFPRTEECKPVIRSNYPEKCMEIKKTGPIRMEGGF